MGRRGRERAQLTAGAVVDRRAVERGQRQRRQLGDGVLDLGVRAAGVDDPAQPGDLYLCCSDGLWEMVPEEALAQTLTASRALLSRGPEAVLQDACRQLLLLACEAGGLDNVTVLLALLGESEVPSGASPDTAS